MFRRRGCGAGTAEPKLDLSRFQAVVPEGPVDGVLDAGWLDAGYMDAGWLDAGQCEMRHGANVDM